MLKIAIASLFTKNKKYADSTKIKGTTGGNFDGWGYWVNYSGS